MDYEAWVKLAKGEMPDDWYRVPATEADLISIIRDFGEGGVIPADAPIPERFSFGETVSGKTVVFHGGEEFLDGNGKKPNPDYAAELYDTPEQAVKECRVGGKPLWPMSKGRRFFQCDASMTYPDEVERRPARRR